MKNRLITLAALAALISLPAFAEDGAPKAKGKNPDKDGDGFVSKEEFMALPNNSDAEKAGKRFAQLDKDGDGKLTADEMKAGAKAKGKKGEGKKEKSE